MQMVEIGWIRSLLDFINKAGLQSVSKLVAANKATWTMGILNHFRLYFKVITLSDIKSLDDINVQVEV